MENFEKLGVFYLGRPYDLAAGKAREGFLLYDAKDLTTHCVCVGMTGSGKTGLCIDVLEEAALDGIPALVIDPKGDMTNLLLAFPDLQPADFRPWINEDDALKSGLDPDSFAASQAERWQKGLQDWGQSGERIRAMQQQTDFALYTPGSTAGQPLSILRSFACPAPAILQDSELLREQVSGTAASLLGLVGLEADPIKSRDHILLSTIILSAWQTGRDLDLAQLIEQIQNPPVSQIGVMSLDAFYPAKDRFALALQFNNLLASPSFANWLEGDALAIDQLLYTASGKPKISIFSIAHLSEAERMFFVSLLLNQVLAWIRTQPGTSSLRAILYMDEIFGYFPPVANPPSKAPLLMLLKQARAYGLGIMLTTQNPVDLDYKGLSNTGTWFIGRLQTERDKQRVLEGLEGASASQGQAFDRATMEQTLAGLGKRVFLMHNVHDDQPTLFETRWSLSYLCGPLTRPQIQKLSQAARPAQSAQPAQPTQPAQPAMPAPAKPTAAKPVPAQPVSPTAGSATTLPAIPGVQQYVMPLRRRLPEGAELVYQPMVLGHVQIGFRQAKANIQQLTESTFIAPVQDTVTPVDWEQAIVLDMPVNDLETTPAEGARLDGLPAPATLAKNYTDWERELKNWLYQTQQLNLLQSAELKQVAALGESEREFRIRLGQVAREQRDAAVDQLREKYAVKIKALEEKIRKSEQAVEREQQQAKQQQMQTAISFGATLMSAFLGKKKVSASSLGRATTAVRGASRAMKEAGDVNRSKESLEVYQADLKELEQAFQAESETLSARFDPASAPLETLSIRPTKQDIQVKALVLVWMPHFEKPDGSREAAWV